MSRPEWIVSRSSEETSSQPPGANEELVAVAKRLWPRVQTHARKKLPKWNPDDPVTLATRSLGRRIGFCREDPATAKQTHIRNSWTSRPIRLGCFFTDSTGR